MIQRPQTIYFLAVAALAAMMAFSDIVFFTNEGPATPLSEQVSTVEVEFDETTIITGSVTSELKNSNLVYFLLCIGALALGSLGMFKNRKMQVTLSAINFLFILGMVYLMYHYSMGMDYIEGEKGSLTASALLPLALIFFNLVAIRRVRKDEKLVRSMDRFR